MSPTLESPVAPSPLPEGEEHAPRGVTTMAFIRWAMLLAVASAALYTLTLGVAPPFLSRAPSVATVATDGGSLEAPGVGPNQDAGVPGLAAVDLPEEGLRQLGAQRDTARLESITSSIRAFGEVTADESRRIRVHVRYSGYIERLFVSTQGALVHEGDPLASISSDDLLRLEEELLQGKKWGGDTLGPLRERLRLLGVSDKEIAQVEVSGKPLTGLTLRSPASGYVTALWVAQGDRVDPDRALFEITDLSRVWFVAQVPEHDVGRIKAGLAAALELDAFPGEPLSGRVDEVSPVLSLETRSLPIRVSLPNPGERLKPGLFGHVRVALPPRVGITVATEAVVDTGQHQVVFVESRPGHYEPRLVRRGELAGERVEILDGIADGETVVTTGNFFVDSESRLRFSATSAPAPVDAKGKRSPDEGPDCEADFDARAFPDKYAQCRTCERVHRGMGSMEADCKSGIPKPWRQP